MPVISIEQAIEDTRNGKFLIVVDDEDRENEGDLTIAAERITPDTVNFMAKFGRGLICVGMMGERLDELQIPMMVSDNTSRFTTAFTVSVDAANGISTGISAFDRALTIQTMLDPRAKPSDLARPGHIFPLRAREGGVLVRAGQTEAGVDLARLAGLYPSGVICEVMNDDGTMARMPNLNVLSAELGIGIVTISDLIEYRRRHEHLVRRVATAALPTRRGDFTAHAYENVVTSEQGMALVKGDVSGDKPILVRIHSECLTGDVFGSLRCDCGEQLDLALAMIEQEGRGILLHMRQEGRGIGLMNKLRAYELQDHGFDTVEANERLGFKPDLRDYGTGAQILADLGVKEMRLLTNNPRKVVGLEGYGLKVVERIPLTVDANICNARYLETKRDKLGHMLDL